MITELKQRYKLIFRKQMKTIGGHKITHFKKLKGKILQYGHFRKMYSGKLINDYTKELQSCYWDENGEVVNRAVPKYDIDLDELNAK